VSVPVAQWLGERLNVPTPYDGSTDQLLRDGAPWPRAAWGKAGKAYRVDRGMWPVRHDRQHLAQFLIYPKTPLSERATAGFRDRIQASETLRFPAGFEKDVERHLRRMRRAKQSSA
jgi:DNA (cytosine-5)-methyltransferase 1